MLTNRLTEREKEITRLLCLGYVTKEIAQQLDVNTSTVKSHIRNIINKSGVGTRIGVAVMYAKENPKIAEELDIISNARLITK